MDPIAVNAESEAPPQQPDPKRPKMSTTSDEEPDDVAITAGDGEKKPRYKRRKIAIFFAYCGVGYQGMQKNPGAKTIEGDLEEALFHSAAVPEHDRFSPRRYDFARSARTDKGVSAVGQVVSGRFYVDPPGFIERLNSNLSPQIRVFGFKRTTGAFNAKKFCDRRRYVYLIPVFALDPLAHRDRESVKASVESGDEALAKCLECSDRGRKVEGLMGKRSYQLRGMSFESDIPSNSCDAKVEVADSEKKLVSFESDISSNVGDAKVENGSICADSEMKLVSSESGVPSNSLDAKVESKVENEIVCADSESDIPSNGCDAKLEGDSEEAKPSTKSNFCYGDIEKERFNRILKNYEGTHNFHNFTTRTKAEDPAAKRFIISFNADTVVTVHGMDFVKCEVVGQSFMLHQIRKMIGLAVAVMRNFAPESLLQKALQKDVKVNVPTAPEVGLYLDECFFSSYNQKWKDSHEEMSMKDYKEEAETFKMKYIYPHIGLTEQKEGVVALWCHSLNHRNYPDLQDGENAINKISVEGVQGEEIVVE